MPYSLTVFDPTAMDSLSRSMISRKDLVEPSDFVRDTPNLSITPDISSVGFARFARAALSVVPAWLPFIPAFAISPIASAVSSAVILSAPATGATYLNVSPIKLTLVFALELVAARRSAKCEASSACSPNAVRASVTISEVEAKSFPLAVARVNTPEIPLVICAASHPAIAMYSYAPAISKAFCLVLGSKPSSLAVSLSDCISSAVAPLIAATLSICDS